MGIFDIIELKQHIRAISEYIVYLDAHRDDFDLPSSMICEHVKKIETILDILEKNP